jgi:hypothetical protein
MVVSICCDVANVFKHMLQVFSLEDSFSWRCVPCNINRMLRLDFLIIKVMSSYIFSTCFLVLQILNFNIADIVFGCCDETYVNKCCKYCIWILRRNARSKPYSLRSYIYIYRHM